MTRLTSFFAATKQLMLSLEQTSIGDHRYALVGVDDHTHPVWAFPLRCKDQVVREVQQFLTALERQFPESPVRPFGRTKKENLAILTLAPARASSSSSPIHRARSRMGGLSDR
jgi:hypothetical protein